MRFSFFQSNVETIKFAPSAERNYFLYSQVNMGIKTQTYMLIFKNCWKSSKEVTEKSCSQKCEGNRKFYHFLILFIHIWFITFFRWTFCNIWLFWKQHKLGSFWHLYCFVSKNYLWILFAILKTLKLVGPIRAKWKKGLSWILLLLSNC